MSHDRGARVDQLGALLTEQRFSSVVIHNYCRSAELFLEYLARRDLAIDAATPDHVSGYLRYARRKFSQRHGRPAAPRWESIPRAGIHALLRLVQKRWPPELPPASPAEALGYSVCNEYQEWLEVQRGLAKASVRALMWEGRNFLSWYAARSPLDDLRKLNVREIDSYWPAPRCPSDHK